MSQPQKTTNSWNDRLPNKSSFQHIINYYATVMIWKGSYQHILLGSQDTSIILTWQFKPCWNTRCWVSFPHQECYGYLVCYSLPLSRCRVLLNKQIFSHREWNGMWWDSPPVDQSLTEITFWCLVFLTENTKNMNTNPVLNKAKQSYWDNEMCNGYDYACLHRFLV